MVSHNSEVSGMTHGIEEPPSALEEGFGNMMKAVCHLSLPFKLIQCTIQRLIVTQVENLLEDGTPLFQKEILKTTRHFDKNPK